jgi:hypothetical protein
LKCSVSDVKLTCRQANKQTHPIRRAPRRGKPALGSQAAAVGSECASTAEARVQAEAGTRLTTCHPQALHARAHTQADAS